MQHISIECMNSELIKAEVTAIWLVLENHSKRAHRVIKCMQRIIPVLIDKQSQICKRILFIVEKAQSDFCQIEFSRY